MWAKNKKALHFLQYIKSSELRYDPMLTIKSNVNTSLRTWGKTATIPKNLKMNPEFVFTPIFEPDRKEPLLSLEFTNGMKVDIQSRFYNFIELADLVKDYQMKVHFEVLRKEIDNPSDDEPVNFGLLDQWAEGKKILPSKEKKDTKAKSEKGKEAKSEKGKEAKSEKGKEAKPKK